MAGKQGGRPKGSKSTYTVTPAAKKQREIAALLSKQSSPKLRSLTDCRVCPVRSSCPAREEKEATGNIKLCPLYDTYFTSLTNTVTNPITNLASDIAKLDAQLTMQQMQDGLNEEALSPLYLKALDLKVKAAKIVADEQARADKRGTQRVSAGQIIDMDEALDWGDEDDHAS